MKNEDTWFPTKYSIKNNRLVGSKNKKFLNPSSRIIADKIADFYSEIIPKYCHGQLADIGCGYAPMYSFYKKYVESVTLIDWTGTLHKNKWLDIEADLDSGCIPDVNNESFNVAICSDLLEHLYHPSVVLKEIHRVLKEDGYLLLNVPFNYWVHEAPYDYARYTNFALCRMLEENGYKIVELHRLGDAMDVLADTGAKVTHTIFGKTFGGFLAVMLQKTPQIFRCLPLVRKKLNPIADCYALSYGIVAQKVTE
ncbi:MAG: class I SAM-dependent methyltransferase [Planctomycetia bacterium]|nr:class I SAM-dependent methyltransferase [Planctomycetia bacterium]